jgi:phosphoribosylanthranilate isomerase
MRTRIKFCGLRRQEDVDAAVAAGADALGFVLWAGSPRAATAAEVAGLRSPAPVPRVGVLVNASLDEARAAMAVAALQAVQLHGDEDARAYASLGVPIIRAVGLKDERDVRAALALPTSVTVLVDGAAGAARGGTGTRANWELAAEVARRRPVILAGGLTPGNVKDAVTAVRPWGVDVSSGVESAPGVKDHAKLRAFAAAVAAGDREDE